MELQYRLKINGLAITSNIYIYNHSTNLKHLCAIPARLGTKQSAGQIETAYSRWSPVPPSLCSRTDPSPCTVAAGPLPSRRCPTGRGPACAGSWPHLLSCLVALRSAGPAAGRPLLGGCCPKRGGHDLEKHGLV